MDFHDIKLYLNVLNQINLAIDYLNQSQSDSAINVLISIENTFISKIAELLAPFKASIKYLWSDNSELKNWKIVGGKNECL